MTTDPTLDRRLSDGGLVSRTARNDREPAPYPYPFDAVVEQVQRVILCDVVEDDAFAIAEALVRFVRQPVFGATDD